MARLRLQAAGLVIAFVLLGSLAFYTFVVENRAAERNSQLVTEVAALQGEVTSLTSTMGTLQSELGALQSSIPANLTSLQGYVLQTNSSEAKDAQQIASLQATLRSYQSQLSNLSSEIDSMRTGNSNVLSSISFQLQNMTARIRELRANLSSIPPSVLLRTTGTALGAFVERGDELTYLRLMEIGGASIVEASLASHPFNATAPGAMVEWKAVTNNVSADAYHSYWPMVLENTPGGTNALEFEDAGGIQVAAVVTNGIRTTVPVSWDSTAVNTFAIQVVSPGHEIDFFINGHLVASFTSGVPTIDFLLEGAEVKGSGSSTPVVATLDTYGGLLGGT
jgi:prefoldin subunit 5